MATTSADDLQFLTTEKIVTFLFLSNCYSVLQHVWVFVFRIQCMSNLWKCLRSLGKPYRFLSCKCQSTRAQRKNINKISTRTDPHLLLSPTSFQSKRQEKEIYLYSSNMRSSSFCLKNNLNKCFPTHFKNLSLPVFLPEWGNGDQAGERTLNNTSINPYSSRNLYYCCCAML